MNFCRAVLALHVLVLPCASEAQGQAVGTNGAKVEIASGDHVVYAPSISATGNTIVFQRQVDRKYLLIEASRIDGVWSEHKPIHLVNNSGDERDLIGGPSISADGNTLLFFRTMGQKANAELFYSKRSETGWSVPLAFPTTINTPLYQGFPSLSADETTLYFVGQNLEGPRSAELKKQDLFCMSIYASGKDENGNWLTPEKLPWPVNQDCEKAPRIMADGRTLLFSSNRPGGKGAFDVYKSVLDKNGQWSHPEPLSFLNTPLDDQLPSVDARGERIYFTHGNKEIHSLPLPEKFKPKPMALVSGLVRNKQTGLGIECEIDVAARFGKKFKMRSSPVDGFYSLVLPLNDHYTLTFIKPGYATYSQQVDLLRDSVGTSLNANIDLVFGSAPASVIAPAASVPPLRREARSGKRVALVIGIKSYSNVPPLLNTLNDARSMSSALKTKGFETIEVYDPKSRAEIRDAVIRFSQSLRGQKDGVGLLFYAGHGMQVDGSNYLVPTEAKLELKADVEDQCMNVDYVLRAMEENGNGLNILILDACRNNPFRGFSRAGEQGLNMVAAPRGSYIVYATKPGSVASDGTGENGLFTSKLLKYINTPELNIEQVFKYTAADVSRESDDKQRPWIASDYTGDFFFVVK